MPRSSAAWIAAIDSASSCGPHPNSHFPPPIAQAPIPIGVILKSLCPSIREIISQPSRNQIRVTELERQNLIPLGHSFHPPDDDGKVFLTPGRRSCGIDCCSCFGRGHRNSSVSRRSQNESKILVHETNRKLRCVVVLFGASQF